MTNQNPDTKHLGLDKILDNLAVHAFALGTQDEIMSRKITDQAKQALRGYIAREIIGEDNKPALGYLSMEDKSRNQLRAEQRKALEGSK